MGCKYCDPESRIWKDLIFESDHWKVVFDLRQRYLGKCAKRHFNSMSEMNQEELLDFHQVAKKLEDLLKRTFDATMFNWSMNMNNSYREEPYDAHVHWHFRPRYNHPVEIADTTFNDEEFGRHYDLAVEKSFEYSEEAKEEVIRRLRDEIK